MGRLSGRTALVTGAARRIGRAIAIALAGEGADCLLHHRGSDDDMEATVAACRALGVRADSIRADLLDANAVTAVAEAALRRGVDVLVHNASAFTRSPFFESDAASLRELFRRDVTIHLEVPLLLARSLGEAMAERGFGRIVLLGDSTAEASVQPHYAPYVVSKGAVPTLARVLAVEIGARSPGVTVNAVLPGPILPPEGLHDDHRAMVARQTVLGRWIGAEEVARAVVYLVNAEGVTGTALRVDGGRSVKAG